MVAEPVAGVSAVILGFERFDTTLLVVERLEAIDAVDEVIVVDSGPAGLAAAIEARGGKARAITTPDLGTAARNLGAEAARGRYLLMLDDDSYPLSGAVEALVAAIESSDRLGVVGGLVRNVDFEGEVLTDTGVGSFDWWLRAGHTGPAPPEGIPAFFFPEGGALFRRDAFLEVGGFFAPYFFANSELDLATRLIAAGWDVRYVPVAVFDHLRAHRDDLGLGARALEARIRNHLWYFWLRFPATVAARRIPAYLAFDLVESVARGAPGAWWRGVRSAWRRRDEVRGHRQALPREVIRRAELKRGRRHVVWLAYQVTSRLRPGGRSRERR